MKVFIKTLFLGLILFSCSPDNPNLDFAQFERNPDRCESIVDSIISNNHKPTHLNELLEACDEETVKLIQKDYGLYSNVFKLTNSLLRLEHEMHVQDSSEFSAGKLWMITKNDSKSLLFHFDEHGFAGTSGNNEMVILLPYETVYKRIEISDSNEVILVFQYSPEAFSFDFNKRYNFSKNLADYYDWIVVYLKDGIALKKVFEYECS